MPEGVSAFSWIELFLFALISFPAAVSFSNSISISVFKTSFEGEEISAITRLCSVITTFSPCLTYWRYCESWFFKSLTPTVIIYIIYSHNGYFVKDIISAEGVHLTFGWAANGLVPWVSSDRLVTVNSSTYPAFFLIYRLQKQGANHEHEQSKEQTQSNGLSLHVLWRSFPHETWFFILQNLHTTRDYRYAQTYQRACVLCRREHENESVWKQYLRVLRQIEKHAQDSVLGQEWFLPLG